MGQCLALAARCGEIPTKRPSGMSYTCRAFHRYWPASMNTVSRRRSAGFAFVFLALTSCAARAPAPAAFVPKGNLHALGLKAAADPMVKGARLIPDAVDEEK